MPDPRLKDAMREIRKICQRYRIGAQITLVSKTHSEFGYFFPDWSVVQPEKGPGGEEGIRLRSYEAYYGDKEKQRVAMEESLHCLYSIRDLAGRAFVIFDDVIRQFEKVSGFEPHTEEDL